MSLSGFLLLFTPLVAIKKPASPEVKSVTVSRFEVPISDTTPIGTVSATAVYVYDPDSETVLYEKDSSTLMHPASLTKLMTALVALQIYQTDDVLTVKSAADSIGSTVHLLPGDKLTVENLLFAALVSSGNDAAFTLAEDSPGSYSEFIKHMNQTALELGLRDTHFSNVVGLEGSDQRTTARDLSILAAEAMKNPTLARIVSTKTIVIENIAGTHRYPLSNTNELLGTSGVVGIKTGTTENSGENLITLTRRDGHSVIITLLNSSDRFRDTKQIIDWVFTHFQWQSI